MTSDIVLPALAAAACISGLLLWVSHEVMKSDWYRNIHVTVRYAIGICCGIVGALFYGLLSGDWGLIIGIVALYCPGGALVIALYGKRSIERERGKQQAQAAQWRDELLRSEHDADH